LASFSGCVITLGSGGCGFVGTFGLPVGALVFSVSITLEVVAGELLVSFELVAGSWGTRLVVDGSL